MSVKTAVVIVVYNTWCGDANTCATIQTNTVKPDVVLVVDNSTKDMNNAKFCAEKGWLYHSMSGNAGLSKAYNASLDILEGKADLVVWADDDTNFPEEYFEKISSYVQRDPNADVFIPVVRTKSFMMSPAIFTKRRVIPIQSLDEISGKELTAINSGLCVRMSLYQKFRYDEAIFLDCVDHDFMRWCRENGKRFCLMQDVELVQNFFSESKPAPSARKFRAGIYMKDTRIFDAKCGKSRFLTEWDLLRYRLAIMISCWRNP